MDTASLAAQPIPSVTKSTTNTMDRLCVNTILALAMDAVQPTTPVAREHRWRWRRWCVQRVLRFDPGHPIWPNRDRFVLSAGHASMLLYAMLHLTEVKAVNPKYETPFEVLVERNRRALRAHLGADVMAGLQTLRVALLSALGRDRATV